MEQSNIFRDMDSSKSIVNISTSSSSEPTNGVIHTFDDTDNSYLYKSEVSLSIGDEAAVIVPTPSPRGYPKENITSENDDVKLRKPLSPSKDKNMGFDNVAFETDHVKPRPLSSFGQNGVNESRSSLKISSEAKAQAASEAVNLELINLNKATNDHIDGNGHENSLPIKRDTEVDIGDPYDEYFVPVNEHRKYMSVSFRNQHGSGGVDHWGHSINEPAQGVVDYKSWMKVPRGEKLYVTKDKRTKSKWNKWLCWTICGTIFIVAIIIAILAGTGVISTTNPTLVNTSEFNTSTENIHSASAFGGSQTGKSHDLPQSADFPISKDTLTISATEESVEYVENALDGQLILTNLEYLNEYEDKKSPVYEVLARELADALKNVLNINSNIEEQIFVKILSMRPGSVIIDYRLSWPKNVTKPFYTTDSLYRVLQNYLDSNHGYLLNYVVPTHSLSVSRLPNLCTSGTNTLNCESSCMFHERFGDFICQCPNGFEVEYPSQLCKEKHTVDAYNGYEITRPSKSLNDDNIVDEHYEKKQSTLSGKYDQKKEQDTFNYEEVSKHPQMSFGGKIDEVMEKNSSEYTYLSLPDTSTESSYTNPQTSHTKTNENRNNFHRSSDFINISNSTNTFSVEFEQPFEPEPSSETESANESEFSSEIVPSIEIERSSSLEPSNETGTSIETEPSTEPGEQSSVSESSGEPDPSSEPEPSYELQTESSTDYEPSTEPSTEREASKSEPTSKPEPSTETAPTNELELSSKPEPLGEPETSSEPVSSSETVPSIEPELYMEPQPDPSTEPNALIESEPLTESDSSSKSEPSSETEPPTVPELSNEAAAATERVPSSVPEPSNEPKSSSKQEKSPALKAPSPPQPSSELKALSESEQTIEPYSLSNEDLLSDLDSLVESTASSELKLSSKQESSNGSLREPNSFVRVSSAGLWSEGEVKLSDKTAPSNKIFQSYETAQSNESWPLNELKQIIPQLPSHKQKSSDKPLLQTELSNQNTLLNESSTSNNVDMPHKNKSRPTDEPALLNDFELSYEPRQLTANVSTGNLETFNKSKSSFELDVLSETDISTTPELSSETEVSIGHKASIDQELTTKSSREALPRLENRKIENSSSKRIVPEEQYFTSTNSTESKKSSESLSANELEPPSQSKNLSEFEKPYSILNSISRNEELKQKMESGQTKLLNDTFDSRENEESQIKPPNKPLTYTERPIFESKKPLNESTFALPLLYDNTSQYTHDITKSSTPQSEPQQTDAKGTHSAAKAIDNLDYPESYSRLSSGLTSKEDNQAEFQSSHKANNQLSYNMTTFSEASSSAVKTFAVEREESIGTEDKTQNAGQFNFKNTSEPRIYAEKSQSEPELSTRLQLATESQERDLNHSAILQTNSNTGKENTTRTDVPPIVNMSSMQNDKTINLFSNKNKENNFHENVNLKDTVIHNNSTNSLFLEVTQTAGKNSNALEYSQNSTSPYNGSFYENILQEQSIGINADTKNLLHNGLIEQKSQLADDYNTEISKATNETYLFQNIRKHLTNDSVDISNSMQTTTNAYILDLTGSKSKISTPVNVSVAKNTVLNSSLENASFAEKDKITEFTTERAIDNNKLLLEDISTKAPDTYSDLAPTEVVVENTKNLSTMTENVDDGFSVNIETYTQETEPKTEKNATKPMTSQSAFYSIDTTSINSHTSSTKKTPLISTQSSLLTSSNQYSGYDVTEQTPDFELLQNQQSSDFSPFLPEQENNATLLNILQRGHDVEIHNDTEETVQSEGNENRAESDNAILINNVDKKVETLKELPFGVIPLTNNETDTQGYSPVDQNKYIKTDSPLSNSTLYQNSAEVNTVSISMVSMTDNNSSQDVISSVENEDWSQSMQFASKKYLKTNDNTSIFVTTTPLVNDESINEEDATAVSTMENIKSSSEATYTHPTSSMKTPFVKLSENDLKVIPLSKDAESLGASKTKQKMSNMDLHLEMKTESKMTDMVQSSSSKPQEQEQINVETVFKNSMSASDQKYPLFPVNSIGFFSKCSAGQFECANGTSFRDGSSCISKSERCDSIIHCSDGSDEYDCEKLGCPGHFQCLDGLCLGRHLVCDGISQCNDGSDEFECDKWQCRFDEISCSMSNGGPCLPSTWKCDGLEQCPSGLDESNCPDNCGNNEFYCSAQKRCIPEIWKCDGEIDCFEEEDERLCDCQTNQFKCVSGGCVDTVNLCDGIPHCPDTSDEWKCIFFEEASTTHSSNDSQIIYDFLLRIKNSNQPPQKICGDEWNPSKSDEVCRKIGLSEADSWTVLKRDASDFEKKETYLKLIGQNESAWLKNFKQVDNCSDGAISIKCAPYECDATSNVPTVTALAVGYNPTVKCLSVLIAPEWALTTFSCIFKTQQFVDSKNKNTNWTLILPAREANEMQEIAIEKIHTFSRTKYHHLMYSGNIVLLKLSSQIKFSLNYKPTCLSTTEINSNQTCTVSLWAANERHEALKSEDVEIITTDECNSTNYFSGSLSENSICSKEYLTSYDTCHVVEGVPLLCASNNNKWSLRGILSYYAGCERQPKAAVYSLITKDVAEWISNTVGNNLMFNS